MPVAALLPLILAAVAWIWFCLRDLARSTEVKGLPVWAWGALIVLSVPIGGILYFVFGKTDA